MDLIVNNQQAVAVNIDYNRLAANSYQSEDYTLVMDNHPETIEKMMKGISTIQGSTHSIELRRSYSTLGIKNMSREEFADTYLYCMSH